MRKLPEISETHISGFISIEAAAIPMATKGDLGIQIAKDGRIWICIDGKAFLRFKPLDNGD